MPIIQCYISWCHHNHMNQHATHINVHIILIVTIANRIHVTNGNHIDNNEHTTNNDNVLHNEYTTIRSNIMPSP